MYPDPMNRITADNDSRVPPPLSEDTAEGTLIISAGYGNRAYPLPGVRAEIYVPAEEDTPDDKREQLYAVRQTEESGIAPPLTIPAPDASLSETPGSMVLPYTLVRIRINEYLQVHKLSQLGARKHEYSLHDYNGSGMDRNRFVKSRMLREIVYGGFYAPSFSQSRKMLRHEAELYRVGRVEIERGSLLMRKSVVCIIIIIAGEHLRAASERFFQFFGESCLSRAASSRYAYHKYFIHIYTVLSAILFLYYCNI